MKLGPVIKIDKRNKKLSKKSTMASYREIVMSLCFFFQFLADLEQSGSQIPDASSAKLRIFLSYQK